MRHNPAEGQEWLVVKGIAPQPPCGAPIAGRLAAIRQMARTAPCVPAAGIAHPNGGEGQPVRAADALVGGAER